MAGRASYCESACLICWIQKTKVLTTWSESEQCGEDGFDGRYTCLTDLCCYSKEAMLFAYLVTC